MNVPAAVCSHQGQEQQRKAMDREVLGVKLQLSRTTARLEKAEKAAASEAQAVMKLLHLNTDISNVRKELALLKT